MRLCGWKRCPALVSEEEELTMRWYTKEGDAFDELIIYGDSLRWSHYRQSDHFRSGCFPFLFLSFPCLSTDDSSVWTLGTSYKKCLVKRKDLFTYIIISIVFDPPAIAIQRDLHIMKQHIHKFFILWGMCSISRNELMSQVLLLPPPRWPKDRHLDTLISNCHHICSTVVVAPG